MDYVIHITAWVYISSFISIINIKLSDTRKPRFIDASLGYIYACKKYLEFLLFLFPE